jgi:MFS family permease
MRSRLEVAALLAGTFVSDLAARLTQVALPLIVIQQTGSAAATGVAAGLAGLPLILSPWWARRTRQWIDSGSRLAIVAALEAAAIALVPAAASAGALSAWLLALSGLLVGSITAISDPGRKALIADVGDRLGVGRGIRLLTWQDTLRRTTMLLGPTLGSMAVAAGLTVVTLWAEAGAVLLAGAFVCLVKGICRSNDAVAPSIREAVAQQPAVIRGWAIRGFGCFMWFAFTLGLALLGVEQGSPGVYAAVGLTGYGVGSVLSSILLVPRAPAMPPLATAALGWIVMGATWVAIAQSPSLPMIAIAMPFGAAAVILGNACVTQTILATTTGASRRSALSGEAVVVGTSSAAGSLVGGPILAALGARPTLATAGVAIIVVSAAIGLGATLRRRFAGIARRDHTTPRMLGSTTRSPALGPVDADVVAEQ